MTQVSDKDVEMAQHVRDRCLCLHAQRYARALARRFDTALQPLGLTSGQFSLLMAICRRQPPAMGPVAALLDMDRTTLTAALKPLSRQGWVSVSVDALDRRHRLLVLTPAGQALLRRALPIWCRTHTDLESGALLDPESFRQALRQRV